MSEQELSAAEAELYDRQIRLWGIESQEKLRASNVLLINIRSLGSEIAKNILLSGINSLTILDDKIVTDDDCSYNFLLGHQHIGHNICEAVVEKAQALNPLVKIHADTGSLNDKTADYYSKFTIVIATELPSTQHILNISAFCRENKVKFLCGDNFGMFAYAFADFQEHQFYEDRVKYAPTVKRSHEGKAVQEKAESTTYKVLAKYVYPHLSEVIEIDDNPQKVKRRSVYYYLMLILLAFRDKHSREPNFEKKTDDIEIMKSLKAEILPKFQVNLDKLSDEAFDLVFGKVVPVCSIIGGIISQEAIKAVSGSGNPIYNTFILDPLTYAGREEAVGANIQPAEIIS